MTWPAGARLTAAATSRQSRSNWPRNLSSKASADSWGWGATGVSGWGRGGSGQGGAKGALSKACAQDMTSRKICRARVFEPGVPAAPGRSLSLIDLEARQRRPQARDALAGDPGGAQAHALEAGQAPQERQPGVTDPRAGEVERLQAG